MVSLCLSLCLSVFLSFPICLFSFPSLAHTCTYTHTHYTGTDTHTCTCTSSTHTHSLCLSNSYSSQSVAKRVEGAESKGESARSVHNSHLRCRGVGQNRRKISRCTRARGGNIISFMSLFLPQTHAHTHTHTHTNTHKHAQTRTHAHSNVLKGG